MLLLIQMYGREFSFERMQGVSPGCIWHSSTGGRNFRGCSSLAYRCIQLGSVCLTFIHNAYTTVYNFFAMSDSETSDVGNFVEESVSVERKSTSRRRLKKSKSKKEEVEEISSSSGSESGSESDSDSGSESEVDEPETKPKPKKSKAKARKPKIRGQKEEEWGGSSEEEETKAAKKAAAKAAAAAKKAAAAAMDLDDSSSSDDDGEPLVAAKPASEKPKPKPKPKKAKAAKADAAAEKPKPKPKAKAKKEEAEAEEAAPAPAPAVGKKRKTAPADPTDTEVSDAPAPAKRKKKATFNPMTAPKAHPRKWAFKNLGKEVTRGGKKVTIPQVHIVDENRPDSTSYSIPCGNGTDPSKDYLVRMDILAHAIHGSHTMRGTVNARFVPTFILDTLGPYEASINFNNYAEILRPLLLVWRPLEYDAYSRSELYKMENDAKGVYLTVAVYNSDLWNGPREQDLIEECVEEALKPQY